MRFTSHVTKADRHQPCHPAPGQPGTQSQVIHYSGVVGHRHALFRGIFPGSPDIPVGQFRPGRTGRCQPGLSMARTMRAWTDLKPKAMQVMSRILVFTDSTREVESPWAMALRIDSRAFFALRASGFPVGRVSPAGQESHSRPRHGGRFHDHSIDPECLNQRSPERWSRR